MSVDFPSLRARHDLIQVAARYIEPKKIGSEYTALCPFHDDRRPSLTFYYGTDSIWRYRCFSCGAAGDVLDFVAEINHVTVAEAVKILDGGHDPKPGAFKPTPKPDEAKCWEPIIPVPADAPEYDPAQTYNPKAGAMRCYRPTRVDAYRDEDGELICHVVRLDFEDGAKITPVITFCEGPGGVRQWCAQRMNPPYRTLMGLDELNARPAAHVLLVSGEKCKVEAAKRLPKFVVTTWMGGDGAVRHADLNPLKGRHVLLFADADASGLRAMWEAGTIIAAQDAPA